MHFKAHFDAAFLLLALLMEILFSLDKKFAHVFAAVR